MNKRLRKKRGIYTKFSDKDVWNLDWTIAQFVLPRLKRYKQVKQCVPGRLCTFQKGALCETDSIERWNKLLDAMIWSFEQIVDDSQEPLVQEGEEFEDFCKRHQIWENKLQYGLDVFAKYFRDLWW